jgi:hypothetical protein
MKMSDLTEQEQRIISGFRKLTKRQQEIVKHIIWLLGELDDSKEYIERKAKDQFWEMFSGQIPYADALKRMESIK